VNINDLTIGQAKELAAAFGSTTQASEHPIFNGPVIAQFIGRFVFVCNLEIRAGYCYLTNVRNVRYWAERENGLGGFADLGPISGDRIDDWPDQVIPIDKLGPVMPANMEKWS